VISRRSFIGTVAFGIFFLPLTAAAQPASKRVVRIGYLGVTPRPTDESFRQGLRELGYVEGQNIAIEYRGAEVAPVTTTLLLVSWSASRWT